MKIITDTRIFLLLLCVSAMFVWQLALMYLCILMPFVVFIYFYKTKKHNNAAFFALNTFVVFWIIAIFLIKSISFNENSFSLSNVCENMLFSLHFGLRLTTMGIIGLLIAYSISAIELAYTLTWFFKPFFKVQAWKIGLLCFLVLHLIPHFFQIALEIKRCIEYRFANTKGYTLYKVKLFFLNFIKQLALQNTELSHAIILRGMYSEQVYNKKWNKLSLATISNMKLEFMLLVVVVILTFCDINFQ